MAAAGTRPATRATWGITDGSNGVGVARVPASNGVTAVYAVQYLGVHKKYWYFFVRLPLTYL